MKHIVLLVFGFVLFNAEYAFQSETSGGIKLPMLLDEKSGDTWALWLDEGHFRWMPIQRNEHPRPVVPPIPANPDWAKPKW